LPVEEFKGAKQMMPRVAVWTALLLSTIALGQDARDITLQEIDRNCREWAEQDEIEESELATYLSECRRLEAESYGLLGDEEPTEPGEGGEHGVSVAGDSDS
jgi:hypothetical protein